MDPTRYNPKLAAYWGVIQREVQNKASVSKIWASVKAEAAKEGGDLSGVRIFDMNQLRSLAVGMRNASINFMKAGANDTIDSTMISQDINSRGLRAQNELPVYSIRIAQNVVDNGAENTVWRTFQYTGSIPSTKSALMAELEANAFVLANHYNQVHQGIGAVQISVV